MRGRTTREGKGKRARVCVRERKRERVRGVGDQWANKRGVHCKEIVIRSIVCHIYITFVLLREWLEIISLNFSAAAVVVFMIVIVDVIIVVVVVVVDATSTTESEKEKPRT